MITHEKRSIKTRVKGKQIGAPFESKARDSAGVLSLFVKMPVEIVVQVSRSPPSSRLLLIDQLAGPVFLASAGFIWSLAVVGVLSFAFDDRLQTIVDYHSAEIESTAPTGDGEMGLAHFLYGIQCSVSSEFGISIAMARFALISITLVEFILN